MFNISGWSRQPDGTYVRKTSSWASWSKTGSSANEFDKSYLNRVQSELEAKAKANLLRDNFVENQPDQSRTRSVKNCT